VGFCAAGEEAYAFQDCLGSCENRRDRSGTKNEIFSRSKGFRCVNLVQFDSHTRQSLAVSFVLGLKDCLHAAAQQFDRRGRNYAFRRRADAHDRVHASAFKTRKDAWHQVSISDKIYTRASRPKALDKFLVAWTVQHGHSYFSVILAAQSFSNPTYVLLWRQADIDHRRGFSSNT